MKASACDCVILCGGFGKRLQSVIRDVPKVMADVQGRPFLDFIIDYARGQGIARVILCTGYKADYVEDYYRRNDFSLKVIFSRENEPLGTGGALMNARDLIDSDPFFVLNGDSLLKADLQALLDFHRAHQAVASLLVSQVKEGADFGNLMLEPDGSVKEFHEKITGVKDPLVNAGIYCLSRSIFTKTPAVKKFSVENDLFPGLAGNGLYALRIQEEFIDIGTPQRYAAAKKEITKGKDHEDRRE